MQINKTSFVAGAGSVVLLGAALIPGLVGAQSATETPSAPETPSVTPEAIGDAPIDIECGPGLRGVLGVHAGEDLAAALGVTTEELQAAVQSAHESLGETLPARATREGRLDLKEDFEAALAAALGVTVEELDAAQEQVKAEKQAEAIARVNEKVADGTLTQDEADAIIERIESGERFFEFRGGRGFGGPRGFGGGLFEDVTPSVMPGT